jgi:hypothetical protein
MHNLARLFADDTSISYSGSNFETMETDINNDLINVNEWANDKFPKAGKQ